MLPFRRRLTFEQRRTERQRIAPLHPNRIPVIAEAATPETPRCDKEKFLVPPDLTAAQFLFVLRKRIRLTSQDALFLLVANTVPPASAAMWELHGRHAETDGFLYVVYTRENTFG